MHSHIYLILLGHFIGDFVLQTTWQARNKSKDWRALWVHSLTYTCVIVLSVGWLPASLVNIGGVVLFLAAVLTSHAALDAVSSRLNKKYFDSCQFGKFFYVLGCDQMLHYASMFALYQWLVIAA